MMITKQTKLDLIRRLSAVAMMALMVSHAEAATLKTEALIAGSNVTVGDLFEGVVQHGDYALAPAPQPGKPLVLRAHDLTRVAETFNIDWRPQTGHEQVVLKSTAEPVGRDELLKALQIAAADMNTELQLPDHLNLTANGTPRVENLSVDDQRQTFTARVALPQADGTARVETVTGRAFTLVQVPVLKTALQAGDMIGTADVEYVTRRRDMIPGDTLLDTGRIVGMTPRRGARLGQPLQANDLESPMMVKKGQTVTLSLKNGAIALSLQGKAMQNGGEGDVVRVLNPASNQVVEGVVSGFQTVSVTPPAAVLMN